MPTLTSPGLPLPLDVGPPRHGRCRRLTGALCSTVLLASLLGDGRGSVVFPNGRGRLQGLTLYSPNPSRFLGPQIEDDVPPRTLDIYIHYGDACDPNQIDAVEVAGKAVIMGGDGACSYFQLYDNFARKRAAALLDTPASNAQPGRFVHWRDGPETDWHRRHPMLLLETDADGDIAAIIAEQGTSPDGLRATISIDPNEWVDVFASWPYQVFVRWLPTVLFATASAFAGAFLVAHLQILYDRFTAKVRPERRTARRWYRFITSKLYGAHLVALLIEMLSSIAMAIVIGVSGFYSTSNAPAWVTLFFTMQMTGWALAATFLSSIVWNSRLSSIMPRTRRKAWWPARVLRGDYCWATTCTCLFVILLELAVDVWFVTYLNWLYYDVPFGTIVSATFCALEVLLGTNFLFGVIKYLVEVSRTATSIPSRDTAVHRILRRIWWCAGVVGLSMVGVAACAAMMFIDTNWFFRPAGWTICWGVGSTARATGSLGRVFVFQPRRPKGESHTTRTAASTRATKRWSSSTSTTNAHACPLGTAA